MIYDSSVITQWINPLVKTSPGLIFNSLPDVSSSTLNFKPDDVVH